MAERRRIVEGTWKCTSCGTAGILGRHKSCPTCGNPRESKAEMQFDFGERTASGATTAETVTDPALLAQAQAGADWSCAFCGSGNAGDTHECRNCKAARPGEAPSATPAPAIQPLAASPTPPRRLSPGARKGCLGASGCGCAALVVGFVVLMAIGWWASQTHEVKGHVVGRTWKREAAREVFTRVTKEGWQDELHQRPAVMPVHGLNEAAGLEAIRDCARRQRGTKKVADGRERVCEDVERRVRCGSEEKCHTRDLGNGYAEEVCDDVPKYCDETQRECHDETHYREEPVYASFCRYDTWEWRPSAHLAESGSDDAPHWPAQPLAALEREKRTATYEVTIEYADGAKQGRHVLRPADEAAFSGWTPGRPAVLSIDNTGEVVSVRPAE